MGIRVIMVTGDQPATAGHIARDVGIDVPEDGVVMGSDLAHPDEITREREEELRSASVFARVTPRQKLDLIALYQKAGSVVGMTGDGVNDAPALRKADIGIAMGKRGTDVACQSADMILQDDRLSTVAAAVREGRTIFENIRKFVVYLLPCHISEITAVTIAAVADAPLPLLPLQILYLNIVTDVFPALALGVGEGRGDATRRSPRARSETILSGRHWAGVGVMGGLMGLGVIAALFLSLRMLGFPTGKAVSISFLTQGFGTLWHVTNVRERGSSFLLNDVTRNPFVWGALALCVGLLVAAVYVPLLGNVLRVQDPGRTGWLVVLGVSAVPWAGVQLYKSLRNAPGGEEA
jgi:Ca2+-transporting ATPase